MHGSLKLGGAAVAAALTLVGAGTSAARCGTAGATQAAAPAPAQCSTSLHTLRPHYENPVTKLSGAAGSLSGAGSTFAAPIMSIWASTYASKGTKVAYQSIGSG